MIHRILLYPNATRDIGYECTRRVASWLLSRKVEVFLPEENYEQIGGEMSAIQLLKGSAQGKIDLAIVFGGDGTMILCAHFLQGTGVPIIGINLGTLGYMTEIEPGEIDQALDQLLSGQYTVEQRLMLEAVIENSDKSESRTFYAVNDIVIHRDLLDGLLNMTAYINHEFMAKFRSDGVIISSPCGSTAYNFSAGGPILSPEADNLILTPLCAHAMLDRSVVVRGDDQLSFYVGTFTRGDHAVFSADGNNTALVGPDTWISVKKSKYTFPLAKVGQHTFYEIMLRKMRP